MSGLQDLQESDRVPLRERHLLRPYRAAFGARRGPASIRRAQHLDEGQLIPAVEAYQNVLLGHEEPDDEPLPAWGSETFLKAFSHLSPEERDVLVSYVRQDLRQTEIAAELHVHQSAVCHKLRTGLARLKYWAHLPPYPETAVWERWDTPVYKIVALEELGRDGSQLRAAARVSRRLRRHVCQSTLRAWLYRLLGRLRRSRDLPGGSPECLSELGAMITWLSYVLEHGQFMAAPHYKRRPIYAHRHARLIRVHE